MGALFTVVMVGTGLEVVTGVTPTKDIKSPNLYITKFLFEIQIKK